MPKIVERKLVSNVVLGYLFTKVLSSDVYFTELPVKIDGLQKLKVSKLTDYVNILLLDSKSRNNLSSNFGGTTQSSPAVEEGTRKLVQGIWNQFSKLKKPFCN